MVKPQLRPSKIAIMSKSPFADICSNSSGNLTLQVFSTETKSLTFEYEWFWKRRWTECVFKRRVEGVLEENEFYTYQFVKITQKKLCRLFLKSFFFCTHILQLQRQLPGKPALILQIQLQKADPERTQDYFTIDQFVRMWKIFVSIAHTHIRPYLPSWTDMNQKALVLAHWWRFVWRRR